MALAPNMPPRTGNGAIRRARAGTRAPWKSGTLNFKYKAAEQC